VAKKKGLTEGKEGDQGTKGGGRGKEKRKRNGLSQTLFARRQEILKGGC